MILEGERDMDRETALELLRSQHEFPGPFEFRVVVRPAVTGVTVAAMVAAAGVGAVLEDVGERKSRYGNYIALHVRMRLPQAEVVLDVYEVLRSVEGVLTSL